METVIEKWPSKIFQLQIGATSAEGGSRGKTVTVGGEATLPFLHFEGENPYPPVVAFEVWDMPPAEWIEVQGELKDVVNDPGLWAKKGEEIGADLICLRLASSNPEAQNTSPQQAAQTVKKVLKATTLPLMIIGSGNAQKDGEVILAASEAAKDEKCLLGIAVKENYKTLTAACLAGGHTIIAESPLDINLAKQLNILISDMGYPLEKIVMHHSTGGLGYGFEYCYTIMERTRLAGLQGDRTMAMPIVNFIAQETWKTKETKAEETEKPEWGARRDRSILWETVCSSGYLQAGSDILVVAHPQTVINLKKLIGKLMKKE